MKARCAGMRGWILLEAQVGLVLLALVVSGAVWTSSEWIQAVGRTHRREAEMRGANALMTAVSLWPREDLDRHLGASRQDRWRLWIERPTPTLYHVRLSDPATGGPLIETWLFREETWAR